MTASDAELMKPEQKKRAGGSAATRREAMDQLMSWLRPARRTTATRRPTPNEGHRHAGEHRWSTDGQRKRGMKTL